jgi:hypothetical protein
VVEVVDLDLRYPALGMVEDTSRLVHRRLGLFDQELGKPIVLEVGLQDQRMVQTIVDLVYLSVHLLSPESHVVDHLRFGPVLLISSFQVSFRRLSLRSISPGKGAGSSLRGLAGGGTGAKPDEPVNSTSSSSSSVKSITRSSLAIGRGRLGPGRANPVGLALEVEDEGIMTYG